jgi:hypothetical protein
MRHHFVPRGGCRRRLRLEKSAIAAPTLDGITVVRAQGSTLARMNPEIRCTNRSHLAVMNALGMSSLLTCPRDPQSRRRSRSHVTAVRTSRGRYSVHLRESATNLREKLSRSSPTGSAAAAAATSPSCAPHGAAAACVPSRSDAAAAPTSPPCAPQGSAAASVSPQIRRRALAHRIRRHARLMGPPSRACPRDPMPQPPHLAAVRASGIRRRERVSQIRRRALAPRIRRRARLIGPPPRACLQDPMTQPLPPRRRARLRDPRRERVLRSAVARAS